jgi:HEAT repeat protein
MAGKRQAQIRALALRATPLLEHLRQHGLRESLRVARGVLVRQVVGRFPRLAKLVNGSRSGQRQTVAERTRPTDVEIVSDSDSGGTLISTLLSDASFRRRAHAAALLAGDETEGATDALLSAIHDPSAEVAIAAIGALGLRAGERVTTALADILRNPGGYYHPMTQAAAVRALGARPEDIERSLWAKAVGALDAELSVAAISTLAERRREDALSLVLPVLQDTSGYYLPMVRIAAAEALQRAALLSRATLDELLRSESDAALRSVLSGGAAEHPVD